ncbi:hypothetical protein BT93_B0124 [Corymbia citriodora subsp. variegata]|nr:hypothetical protein BT93_B0124 [Corymbia citriodora subsp. variegata]
MADLGLSKAINLVVMAVFVVFSLLMSTELATAALAEAVPELQLGRKLLEDGYNTTGRGGYN